MKTNDDFICSVSVRLGEWDIAQDRDCDNGICSAPVVDIPIAYSIPHQNYRPFSRAQQNDIALVRLSQSVTYTDWIRPICLPMEPRLRKADYDGIGLETLGWGYTSSERNGKIWSRLFIFIRFLMRFCYTCSHSEQCETEGNAGRSATNQVQQHIRRV